MNITLTITGETMKEIQEGLSGYGFTTQQSTHPIAAPQMPPMAPSAPAPVTYAPPAPVAAPVQSAPVQAAPMPPMPPMPAAAPTAPIASAPTYTYEQVMKAGADLSSVNPALMPSLMDMFKRYSIQQISDLKPEQLGSFATELRGLGAQI